MENYNKNNDLFQPYDAKFSNLNALFDYKYSKNVNKLNLNVDKIENRDANDDLDIDEYSFNQNDEDEEFRIRFQPTQNKKSLTEQHMNNVLLKSAFNQRPKQTQIIQEQIRKSNPNQHLLNRLSVSTLISKPELDTLNNNNNNNNNRCNLNKMSSINAPLNRPNLQRPLKPVNELPAQYRCVFSRFPYFNYVQSTVFDDVIYTNKNIVISAPTGSGKTVILELAIIQLLNAFNYKKTVSSNKNFKIVYMAPLKALCTEKYTEWSDKFEKELNLKCIELTGDTDNDDENDLNYVENANIICTTPEKWDIMTRKWKNRRFIMSSIKLFLIDEIHVLGESSRGAVIEVVISRMKTFAFTQGTSQFNNIENNNNKKDEANSVIRFVAISATIPNIQDFANWLSSDLSHQTPAIYYKMNETYRPVELKKVVYGYSCAPCTPDFRFDLTLNYKLANIIQQHSNSKPTLVFCSTRKSTTQAAQILAKTNKYIRNQEHKRVLEEESAKLKDASLREYVKQNGIGYHHAGLDLNDRRLIENLFLNGYLPVLMSTSTLAIGVNLPAHLVIIKSTKHYSSNQSYVDYSNLDIHQMIGRAGRPQFDDSATAVIMTRMEDKSKYENLVNDNQQIESHLHENLIEHLNVEIVLDTITNMSTAINWLKSTFLYVRVRKNPQYYNIRINPTMTNPQLKDQKLDEYLNELCIKNLNNLMEVSLIEKCDFLSNSNAEIKPTSNGHLMAKYCLAFETIKLFLTELGYKHPKKENENEEISNIDCSFEEKSELPLIQESKTLEDLIKLVSSSKEFEDVKLRVNEKAILNGLNNNGKMSKTKADIDDATENMNLIKFKLSGKIKTSDMKINVLIQANLGSISINDFGLVQESYRIFRIGKRITKCMLDYLIECEHKEMTPNGILSLPKNFETFLNATILYQCFNTGIWSDSPHLFKQFNKVGATYSSNLINEGIITIEKLLELSPKRLDKILNKNGLGESLFNSVKKLPKFDINFKKINPNQNGYCLEVCCLLLNYDYIKECGDGGTLGLYNPMMFILGDMNNNLLCYQRMNLSAFLNNNGQFVKRLMITKQKNANWVHASLVILNFAGLDVHNSFEVFDEMLQNTQEVDKVNQSAKKFENASKTTKQNNIDVDVFENGYGTESEQDIKSDSKLKTKPINLKRLNSSMNECSLQDESENMNDDSPYFRNELIQTAKKRKLAISKKDSCFETDDEPLDLTKKNPNKSKIEIIPLNNQKNQRELNTEFKTNFNVSKEKFIFKKETSTSLLSKPTVKSSYKITTNNAKEFHVRKKPNKIEDYFKKAKIKAESKFENSLSIPIINSDLVKNKSKEIKNINFDLNQQVLNDIFGSDNEAEIIDDKYKIESDEFPDLDIEPNILKYTNESSNVVESQLGKIKHSPKITEVRFDQIYGAELNYQNENDTKKLNESKKPSSQAIFPKQRGYFLSFLYSSSN